MSSPLHLRASTIWTGDAARPFAREVTAEDGRIIRIDEPPPDSVRIIDVEAGAIVPGFVDAHLHLLLGGRTLGQLDLTKLRSRDEFETAIAARHDALPSGEWLIGQGWSSEHWPGRVLPDKSWLRAAGTRPVVCFRVDGHAVLVNDAVLDRIDFTTPLAAETGRIERDPATGEPTGLMIEAAAWTLVNPLVPKPTPAIRQESLRAAERHLLAHGVTTVGTMEYRRDVTEVYAPQRDHLSLRCRITLLDRDWPLDDDLLTFARSFASSDRLAVIGAKTFIDGTLGGRTARMLADYTDAPGCRGTLLELAQSGTLLDRAHAIAAAGLSPSMHAIGDEAVRLALDVAAALPSAGPTSPRVEHAQQIDPADIPRFAGVIASMQPLHRTEDAAFAERRLGAARLVGSFPFRQLLDHGGRLAFGSDWPIVSCDPVAAVRAAITGVTPGGERYRPEENLTVDEALSAHTRGAAEALGLDDVGTIRVGAAADLAVLDRDPRIHAIIPSEI